MHINDTTEKPKLQTTWASEALQMDDGTPVCLAGRVVNYRKLGSIAFGKLVDQSGKIQFCFNKRAVSNDAFKQWSKLVKMGSIISIKGDMWTSSTGEKTVLVNQEFKLLRDSTHPFPNKKDGIVDPELRLRKRYLSIALDEDYKNVFKIRSKLISSIRHFLEEYNFLEVETPILQPQASGAQARPFKTHHHAFDTDLYLRIAPETYLKRTVASSFDRVFEIGKNFRNEGTDPSHLQEFTSVEWYAAYWDYNDNLSLFKKLLPRLLRAAGIENGIVNYQGTNLNFNNIIEYTFREACQKFGEFDPFDESFDTSNKPNAKETDEWFKRDVRPKLIQPTIIKDYPACMSPLAHRTNDGEKVEQWQFIVNGWELVKCYTELTDPRLQRSLLQEQMFQRSKGDEEAMMLEEDFLECMEYGMPPMSGFGMGLDRLVALLTDQTSLRNVVLFPTVL